MSFDGVFYIKKWCAEQERFFQFSNFLDQAILKVFILVESFLFWITDIFYGTGLSAFEDNLTELFNRVTVK